MDRELPTGGSRGAYGRSSGAVSNKAIVLLGDEAPIAELDELRPLIAEGQERGFLTFGQIATCLEEIDVTKEQVQELHPYLDDQGIDVVEPDGRLARSHPGTLPPATPPAPLPP